MNNALKLGIFTLVGIAAIIASIFTVGSFSFHKTYHIYAKFDNISGLMIKAKVKIAGVDIGFLDNISLEDGKANLRLNIEKTHILHKNASASIASMGLIGTKYIEIAPGDYTYPPLQEGDIIGTSKETSLDNVLTKLSEKIEASLQNGLIDNVYDTVMSLKNVLANLENQNRNVSAIVENILNVSAKLDLLITHIYSGKGPLGTIINDDRTTQDIKTIIADAKTAASNIKNISSSLGKTISKTSELQISWDYTGRYNSRYSLFRNDIGVTVTPNKNKFYYVGISNVSDTKTLDKKNDSELANSIDALIGFRRSNAQIYGGLIRGSGGLGVSYSFFESISSNYKTLQLNVNAHNFARKNNGSEIDAGIAIGITRWLYVGTSFEDIAYKSAITPYIKLQINDDDIASILGIASLAAVASR
ncbi:MAG: MlaD family protein [Elusimicrobiota bacterium]|jgi:phospholipid/cholesterol/gamma-HCH transport system substrate-binding protein|nr:MlaD family protein [Elusimicrobiota bacterium]